MIQAIIFDVGGVLIRTVDHGPRRQLEARHGLQRRESEQIVFASEMGTRAQTGAISEEELWAWIGQHLQLDDGDLRRFRAEFWAGDELDRDLVNVIRRLRPTYQTAIISNATNTLRRSLTDTHDVADAFDLIVCSAEEGIMKPDPEIYRRTLKRLGRAPQEAAFVDDAPENVDAARELGMKAIRYEAGMDVPAALAHLGIGPLPRSP